MGATCSGEEEDGSVCEEGWQMGVLREGKLCLSWGEDRATSTPPGRTRTLCGDGEVLSWELKELREAEHPLEHGVHDTFRLPVSQSSHLARKQASAQIDAGTVPWS